MMRYVAPLALAVLVVAALMLGQATPPVQSAAAPLPPLARAAAAPPAPEADAAGVLTASRVDEIAAPISGVVERLLVNVGRATRTGQGLATIVPDDDVAARLDQAVREWQLAELARDRAALELRRADAQKRTAEALVKDGLSPRSALDDSRFQFELAEMTLASATQVAEMRRQTKDEQSRRISGAALRASCDCMVSALNLAEGAHVNEREVLVKLARVQDLRVRFVAQVAPGQIAIGRKIELRRDEDGSPEAGEIVSVSPTPLDGSGQTLFEARPDNPDRADSVARLPLGSKVFVRIR